MAKRPQDLTGRNERHLKKLLLSLKKKAKALEDDMKALKKHFKYYINFKKKK